MNNATKILIVIISIPLLSFTGKNKKNDWLNQRLKAKVKTLVEYKYNVVANGSQIDKIYFKDSTKSQFDVKGNYLKNNAKYDKGNLIEEVESGIKNTYVYDKRNNVIEKTAFINGVIENRIVYKYYSMKHKIKTYEYRSENLFSLSISKNDSRGNPIKICQYRNDTLTWQAKYKYDINNNLIELKSFTSKGILTRKDTWQYDKWDGNIEFEAYNKSDSLLYKQAYEYEYDNSANWIKKVCYNHDIPIEVDERKIEYYH